MAPIALFFLLCTAVSAQEWQVPKFIRPDEPNPGHVEFTCTEDENCRAIIDEDVKEMVYLAKLNYKGEIKAKVKELDTQYLNPEIVLKDGYQFIVTETSQKYTIVGDLFVKLYVTVGSEGAYFFVFIRDINNNMPILNIDGQECSVKENIVGPTSCVITLEDEDTICNETLVQLLESDSSGETGKFSLDVITVNKCNKKITVNVDKELDYEDKSLYKLIINVLDPPYNVSKILVVDVEDMPDEAPRWKMSPTIFLDEEKDYEIEFDAEDGDVGLNDKLTYSMYVENEYEKFFILETSGKLKINPIDRESLSFFIIYMNATAYDRNSQTSFLLQFIINDINDNSPEIIPCGLTMRFNEGTFYMSDDIYIKDMDEAKNGTYSVYLEDENGKHFTDLFQVIPTIGYQNGSFSIRVLKPESLDYENKTMQQFSFQLVAEEQADNSHVQRCDIKVNLVDVNDEYPQFTNIEDQHVIENAPGGTLITTLKAIDRDQGDTLTYSTTSSSVHVDELSGEVTAIEGMFNYEMQDKMIIQVRVKDAANHSVSGQFVLHILDENDSPPNIFLPFGRKEIYENYLPGYIVSDEIRAKDLDTFAELKFHIDWDGSSATQQGTKQDMSVFMDTFAMNDSCGCDKDIYKACSCLQIAKELDWKDMDTLYLSIAVTDVNTTVNAINDSALLVILIKDINNHPPEFKPIGKMQVDENSTSGITIGRIIAFDDKDGPGNNDVTYKLDEINGTPPNLVTIDIESGILSVGESNSIDYERYQKLFYTVTALDGGSYPEPNPSKNFTIDVIDKNDNPPRIIIRGQPDPIKEFSEPGFVFKVESEDDDKTEPFNTITYMFDTSRGSPDIASLFHIDNETGVITTIDKLDYLKASEYNIWILVRDNFLTHDVSNSLTAFDSITVHVLDINNHYPEFQEPKKCEAAPWENTEVGSFIVQVQATDKDTEPDFKDVLYSITNIISVGAAKEPSLDLFKIDENSGSVKAGMNLTGYIGNYNITVMGRNRDSVTPQNNTQSFTICVKDINDHSPIITFPTGGIIQLREEQRIDRPLIQYSGKELPPITAIDEDMDENAMVDFSIYDKGAGVTDKYFYVRGIDTKSADLKLKKQFSIPGDRQFEIVINATDGGDPPRTTLGYFTVQVLTDGHPPYFDINKGTTDFKENDPNAFYTIAPAKDYDNEFKNGCNKIFYYLQDHDAPANFERTARSMNCDAINYAIVGGNDEGLFLMDKNVLKLNAPLDYECKPDEPEYLLKIAATDSEESDDGLFLPDKNVSGTPLDYKCDPDDRKYVLTIAATNPGEEPGDSGKFELTVKVIDENDCYPEFERKSYAEGIGTGDKRGKVIQQFKAIDRDKKDTVTYKLLKDTMTADNSLKPYVDKLDLSSAGELTLQFSPDYTLSGYFSFKIIATDEVQHNDTADVKVYIISDSNRQKFVFENHKSFVDESIKTIEDIFSKYLSFRCTVEQTLTETFSNTEALNRTSVTAHFININESLPVDNSVTELLINEKARELKREFKLYALIWVDATSEDRTSDNGEDQSALTQTVLIVVSALLATLVLLLLATFFFKIRSYNRRLEALSQTKFGSQDSGLNRVNMNVPNTNQHALEGSNPVWNEELDNEDDISQGSGDSELVGVEDNPEFSPQNHRMEARRGSKNPIFDEIENEKEWSSVEYSPDINMNEEKNPNFSFGPPTTNVPTTEL